MEPYPADLTKTRPQPQAWLAVLLLGDFTEAGACVQRAGASALGASPRSLARDLAAGLQVSALPHPFSEDFLTF